MKRLLEFVVALVLKRVLGPVRKPARAPARQRAARPAPRREAAAVDRPRVAIVALAAFGLGSLMLVVFEVWYAWLVGVIALFVFIVVGVFAIATPQLLDAEEERTP